MARQAVPTVFTGDAWTAAQHNTYIRDNESAHWPYTTAGDIPYATSSSALGRLGIGAANTLLNSSGSAPQYSTIASILQLTSMVSSQAQGDIFYANSGTTIARLAKGTAGAYLKMGASIPEWVAGGSFNFIAFTSASTHTSWDGDSKSVNNYTVSVSGFSGGGTIPTSALAVLMSVSAQWGAASGASVCNIRPTVVSNNGLLVRAQTTFFQDNMGVVPLDGLGNFYVTISNASALVYLDIWGYFT